MEHMMSGPTPVHLCSLSR